MPAGERPLLSACIITRDEERDLPGCLATLGFCDEIVVIDSGSVDDTVALAQRAGARVTANPWPGFAAQRNVALDHARGDWVLEIDADERVSAPLRDEIATFVREAPASIDLAALPRRELIAGHALGPSAKYPNYCHRLLRRGALRHDEGRLVHEGLIPEGPVHPFAGELHHLTAARWRDALADTWRYARLEADQLTAEPTATAVLRGALVRPLIKAVYRTVVDGGWRDGVPGLAKIALDCGADSVVWLRVATGRRRPAGDSGVAASLHYGARRFPRGNVRTVAVATGPRAVARAASWAAEATLGGADVTLVADASGAGSAPGVRPRAAGPGPLSIVRALDAEEQLRTIDAVVTFGSRARRAMALVPPPLRGLVAPQHDGADPEALVRTVTQAREALAR